MFEFLGEHPDIYPSRIKEPKFFLSEDERAPGPEGERSLSGYLHLFVGATDQRWLLEASTGYLWSPDAARRIREFTPDARAVVMVRDPVEQIRSLHAHRVFLRWHRSLDLLADIDEDGAFYWKRVCSGKNLRRVLETFSRDDVHTIVYDDFAASNKSEYRRVLEFLGVDPSFTPHFQAVNASFSPRSQAIQQALWGGRGVLRAITRVVLPEKVRKRGFSVASLLNRRSPRPLDPDVTKGLWQQLEADVELLSSLLGRDLVSLWRR